MNKHPALFLSLSFWTIAPLLWADALPYSKSILKVPVFGRFRFSSLNRRLVIYGQLHTILDFVWSGDVVVELTFLSSINVCQPFRTNRWIHSEQFRRTFLPSHHLLIAEEMWDLYCTHFPHPSSGFSSPNFILWTVLSFTVSRGLPDRGSFFKLSWPWPNDQIHLAMVSNEHRVCMNSC